MIDISLWSSASSLASSLLTSFGASPYGVGCVGREATWTMDGGGEDGDAEVKGVGEDPVLRGGAGARGEVVGRA